ncbi:DUF3800 domain-containing protein [Echinicola marina]|uniref:DUF3800 domain-containing protein n=1 Tax=Echinicola marina TaxID=2859768 RepID=UPI001CF66F5A|nr:DUF3800 domain-containing protein [Echinicola marina]UCS93862.1 DUF3800 domain-containing protein [Echinicola marina]
MKKGFFIFCDESVKSDRYYSNFYGGSMIAKEDYEKINNLLVSKKQDIGMEDSELKWSNINAYRVDAYCEMMELYFNIIAQNIIKFRLMFTDNRFIPRNLTATHKQNEYHLLYYQFIKHSFGFSHINSDVLIDLELYFDTLPDKKEKNKKFKGFIHGLQYLPELEGANLQIKKESIYEVDSKKHIILQCSDVILGSMGFRLNNHHKDKPEGQYRRGKRTVAKEKVYRFINSKIRDIRPNFNIGVSTSVDGDPLNKFFHPYRHWLFTPSEHNYIPSSKNIK